MEIWVDNGKLALILGIIVFFVLFIPHTIWQLRRQGAINVKRTFGWAGVCIYFTALFVYTLLPLPKDAASFCAHSNIGYNLTPGGFIADIAADTDGMAVHQKIRSFALLQVVFNVVLFIPFGAILRKYFNRGIIVTTLAGALVSALIELSQVTGLFSIFPCAYRVGDIDDLLLNTCGTLVGALLAPLFLGWMPNARELSKTRLQPRPLTARRRLFGMFIDALLYGVVSFIFSALILAGGIFLGDSGRAALASWVLKWGSVCGNVIALFVVFVIPSISGRRAGSIGKASMWLVPRWHSQGNRALIRGNVLLRVVRSLLIPGCWFVCGLINNWNFSGGVGVFSPSIGLKIVGYILAWIPLIAIIMVPFTRTHRSLSGVLTRATMVDSRDTLDAATSTR